MTNSPLIFICLLACYTLHAQFSFDFEQDSQDLQSEFEGQTDHFIVKNGELHLNAAEAGSSIIFVNTNIPDSLEMGVDFRMDFNPSDNNRLRIYFQLDTLVLEQASGYYIEIGENGAEDKIRFNRIINGEALTIAEGTPGEFAEGPIDCSLKMIRDHSGYWQLNLRQSDEELFTMDLELFDSTLKRYYDQYVALECVYTSTRVDKFHFDNFYLKERVPDQEPPRILSYEVLDDWTISLRFDEVLDKTSAKSTENYFWQDRSLHPATVGFNEFKPNRVVLEFDANFESTQLYRLAIEQLSDLKGNRLNEPLVMDFYYSTQPSEQKDLIINELLFDPVGEGVDFLELYNHSGKILSLEGVIVENATKLNSEIRIGETFDLFPGEYLLICPDTAGLQPYTLPDSLNYIALDLPGFNNDNGNATILYNEILLDAFDYDESMHFPLIDDTEGISLERLSPNTSSKDPSGWHSASGMEGGATPGRENSQFREVDSLEKANFSLLDPLFSPDNDGFQDQLVIQYDLSREGYVGSIVVFDLMGHFVRKVINNQLLGSRGTVAWDGLSASDEYLPIGTYIIICKAFHPSGVKTTAKLVAYLVGE